GLRPVPRLPAKVVRERLAEWRRLLRGSVTQGRSVLQRVVRGRIVFTPAGSTYEFEATTRFDKLFAGIVLPPPPPFVKVGDLAGTEHITTEDTFEADYGRLLERAELAERGNVKNVVTLVGFEPTVSTLKGSRARPLHHRVAGRS